MPRRWPPPARRSTTSRTCSTTWAPTTRRATLRVSAWVNGQSSYYLERSNTSGKFGNFAHLNLSAGYRFSPAISAEVLVRNLFDRYSEYVWWDGAQSLHAPGTPRSVFGTLAVRF
jgi:iron complex outermembrane receptor protein